MENHFISMMLLEMAAEGTGRQEGAEVSWSAAMELLLALPWRGMGETPLEAQLGELLCSAGRGLWDPGVQQDPLQSGLGCLQGISILSTFLAVDIAPTALLCSGSSAFFFVILPDLCDFLSCCL